MYYIQSNADYEYSAQRVVSGDPEQPLTGSFLSGQWIDEGALRIPLRYQLQTVYDEDRPEGLMWPIPDYNMAKPPLVSKAYAECLRAFPVRNVQFFPAELTDPENGVVHRDFFGMNVLGLIAAADRKASRYVVYDGVPLIDVSFDSLILDEKKTMEAPMFRLAENSKILIHQRLRDYIMEKFPYSSFMELDEYGFL